MPCLRPFFVADAAFLLKDFYFCVELVTEGLDSFALV